MENIALIWARSVFALSKLAEHTGMSEVQLIRELSSRDSALVGKLGTDLFGLAYLTWSYKTEYEKNQQLRMADALDWAYRIGNLFGRLELPPNGANFDPVECGRIGSEVRHRPMRELRAWAVARYQNRQWPSANAAAAELEDSVVNHGREIGAVLSKSNARRTIAEWFRKAPASRYTDTSSR